MYWKDTSKPHGNINILYFPVFYHVASFKGDSFYTRGNSDELDSKHNFRMECNQGLSTENIIKKKRKKKPRKKENSPQNKLINPPLNTQMK